MLLIPLPISDASNLRLNTLSALSYARLILLITGAELSVTLLAVLFVFIGLKLLRLPEACAFEETFKAVLVRTEVKYLALSRSQVMGDRT